MYEGDGASEDITFGSRHNKIGGRAMKKNMFDLLENSGEGELDMIDRLSPEFSDEQFERILEMSKRKRNIIRAAKESKNIPWCLETSVRMQPKVQKLFPKLLLC